MRAIRRSGGRGAAGGGLLVAVLGGLVALAGACGSPATRSSGPGPTRPPGSITSSSTTAAPSTTSTTAATAGTDRTTTTTAAPTTTAPAGLPVAVSRALSSPGQDVSVLRPSSCSERGGVLVASGTFAGGFAPEAYVRYGDVVELYAYTAPQAASGGRRLQVASLAEEHPAPLAGRGPWQVTVPVDRQIGVPQRCEVAVQQTHAFMAAGNAGS